LCILFWKLELEHNIVQLVDKNNIAASIIVSHSPDPRSPTCAISLESESLGNTKLPPSWIHRKSLNVCCFSFAEFDCFLYAYVLHVPLEPCFADGPLDRQSFGRYKILYSFFFIQKFGRVWIILSFLVQYTYVGSPMVCDVIWFLSNELCVLYPRV
jgi:hypothetical protein